MTAVDFTIPEVDVLATCLVPGCTWSGYGDSATDAFSAWWFHVYEAHPEEVPNPEPTPEPEVEIEVPKGVPPKPTD